MVTSSLPHIKDLSREIIIHPFIGLPGAGKGTKGKIIETLCHHEHSLELITMSSLADKHIALRTDLGKEFDSPENQNRRSRRQMYPDELVCEALWREILEGYRTRSKRRFITDGFPRTIDQAKKLIEARLNFIAFHLHISPDESEVRVNYRAHTGEVRHDDKHTAHGHLVFNHETRPAVNLMKHHRRGAVIEISATGCVRTQVTKILRHMLERKKDLHRVVTQLDNPSHPARRLIDDVGKIVTRHMSQPTHQLAVSV